MKLKLQGLPLLLALLAAMPNSAQAQWAVADFDGYSEGTVGAFHIEDEIVLWLLDRFDGNGPGQDLGIENASSTLGSFPNFTSSNALDFGSVHPGPIATATRMGRLRIDVPTNSRRADVRLYVLPGASAGNRIYLQGFNNGALVATSFYDIPARGLFVEVNLQVIAPEFDYLILEGAGAQQDGTFNGLLDEVKVLKPTAGTPFCFGDGSITACPCGNFEPSGFGCRNSTFLGATLQGYGTSSLLESDLELSAGQLPPGAPSLLFAAPIHWAGGNGTTFGDGVRCVGGPVERLGIRIADAGGLALWQDGFFANTSAQAGFTHYFQVWYRDPSGPCGAGFNLTSGVYVATTP